MRSALTYDDMILVNPFPFDVKSAVPVRRREEFDPRPVKLFLALKFYCFQ